MSVARKIIGFLLIAIGAGVIGITAWDRPLSPFGIDIDIPFLFKGESYWGWYNSAFLCVGILFIVFGIIVGFFKSTREAKEETAIRHNLESQRTVSKQLERQLEEERKKQDLIKKQVQQKVANDAQKKKAMESQILRGQQLFQAGKFDEAIKIWEEALAQDNKTAVEAIKAARAKLDKIKDAISSQEKRCPYCQAQLLGFEEQCPECFENLLSNEEIVKRYMLAGMERYVEEEYTEAISAWTKVTTVDPNNETAKRYIEKAEQRLDTVSMPVNDAPDMSLPRQGGPQAPEITTQTLPDNVEQQLEPMLEPMAGPVMAGKNDTDLDLPSDKDLEMDITESDLQGIELGDLDLDESESMGNTRDGLGKGDVTSQKTGKKPASDTPDKKVEEVYECEVCGAVMAPNQLTCPKCGTEYDE